MNTSKISILCALAFLFPLFIVGFHHTQTTEIGAGIFLGLLGLMLLIPISTDKETEPATFPATVIYLVAWLVFTVIVSGHTCYDSLHIACDGVCTCDGLGCYH